MFHFIPPWATTLSIGLFFVLALNGARRPAGSRPWDPPQRNALLLTSALIMFTAGILTLARGFEWI